MRDQVVGQQGHPVAVAEAVGQAQLHRVGELLAEPGEDEVRPRAPELVDGLVRVAHHRHPGPVPGNHFQQQVLDLVGVLVLIHQHHVHLVRDQFPQLRVLVHGEHGFVEHVREGDAAVVLTPFLEGVVEVQQVAVFRFEAQRFEDGFRALQGGLDPVDEARGRFHELLLVTADLILQVLRGEAQGQLPRLEVHFLFAQYLALPGGQVALAHESAVQAQPHGMIGSDLGQREPGAGGQVLQLGLEIRPGAAVEHQDQDARRVMALLQQVTDAPCQGGGLPAPGHGGDHTVLVIEGNDPVLFVRQ